ncbi:histidine triad (HIT) protein [Ventosimonas gracilis]|uniref:Histidine triad (HIT) protein n=1 Tax=Ventosimonas gracilis TaxID=1680762 RepID=A0A139SQL4_9GAMM|nr:HIT domain-containing protein [Ventosimonas gracilis]KXU36770.1 histidine triad (HIT) protein [Ventosimonas gracilis]
MFRLDPRLAADCLPLGDFPLCQLLLMNEARYPWFILVPRRNAVTEVFQLSQEDQAQLWQETTRLAETLKDSFAADKINIAALGNQVAQLHVHVIARKRSDAAWPAPVWGRFTPEAYSPQQIEAIRTRLGLALAGGRLDFYPTSITSSACKPL